MRAFGRFFLRVVFERKIVFGRDLAAKNRAGPVVVHAFEAIFGAMANSLPDLILGRNEVGETFTNEGEAGEGGNIGNGSAVEDFDKELGRNRCDGARQGGLVGWRGGGRDSER